jgi:hypothetical protein
MTEILNLNEFELRLGSAAVENPALDAAFHRARRALVEKMASTLQEDSGSFPVTRN